MIAMSEPRTLCYMHESVGDNIVRFVPATVYDLLAAIPKCEHGKIDKHFWCPAHNNWDMVHVRSCQRLMSVCVGGAALGGTDHE